MDRIHKRRPKRELETGRGRRLWIVEPGHPLAKTCGSDYEKRYLKSFEPRLTDGLGLLYVPGP